MHQRHGVKFLDVRPTAAVADAAAKDWSASLWEVHVDNSASRRDASSESLALSTTWME